MTFTGYTLPTMKNVREKAREYSRRALEPVAELTSPEWERQPKESSRAFRGFCLYRDLGYNRTIPQAAELLHKEDGGEGEAKSAGLYRWSKKWRWADRVMAFDNYLANKEVQAHAHARIKAATRHAEAAAEAQTAMQLPITIAAERAQKIAAGELPEDLAQLESLPYGALLELTKKLIGPMVDAQKAERDAYGSTQNDKAADGKPGLPEDELARRRAAVQRIIADRGAVAMFERVTYEVASGEGPQLIEGRVVHPAETPVPVVEKAALPSADGDDAATG